MSRKTVVTRSRLKYGNVPTGGHASRREHKRAQELRLLEKAGKIRRLREQVKFELIPAQRAGAGKLLERECSYIADFVYEEAGRVCGAVLWDEVVEDSKGGMRTPMYILKRKMMLWFHGIRVLET